MRCRIVFALTVMTAFLLLLPGKAFANSCYTPTPCEAFGFSSAVFIGRTVGSTEKIDGYMIEGRTITIRTDLVLFDVEEVFKGVTATQVTISVFSGPFGRFSFARGERYLVYAGYSDSLGFCVGSCSGSKLLDKAKEDLEFLRNPPQEGAGGRLYGQVAVKAASGKPTPLAGVTLILEDETHQRIEVKTDSEGNYEIKGLKPGKYTVKPILPEHYVPASEYFKTWKVVINDRGCTQAPILAKVDGRISGRITDFSGRPAPVEVRLVSADNPEEDYWGETDEGGQYEIEGVPPGRYLLKTDLIVSDNEEPYYHPGVSDESKATVIKLGIGQKLEEYDFQLPPKLQVRTVQGIAKYSDGRPAANVDVQLSLDEDVKTSAFRASDTSFDTITDESGRFTLYGYKDVPYEVVLSDDASAAIREQRRPARAEEIKLTLTKDVVDLEIVLTLESSSGESPNSQKKKSAP